MYKCVCAILQRREEGKTCLIREAKLCRFRMSVGWSEAGSAQTDLEQRLAVRPGEVPFACTQLQLCP